MIYWSYVPVSTTFYSHHLFLITCPIVNRTFPLKRYIFVQCFINTNTFYGPSFVTMGLFRVEVIHDNVNWPMRVREWKLELFDLLDLCAKSRYLAATTPKTTTLKGGNTKKESPYYTTKHCLIFPLFQIWEMRSRDHWTLWLFFFYLWLKWALILC